MGTSGTKVQTWEKSVLGLPNFFGVLCWQMYFLSVLSKHQNCKVRGVRHSLATPPSNEPVRWKDCLGNPNSQYPSRQRYGEQWDQFTIGFVVLLFYYTVGLSGWQTLGSSPSNPQTEWRRLLWSMAEQLQSSDGGVRHYRTLACRLSGQTIGVLKSGLRTELNWHW